MFFFSWECAKCNNSIYNIHSDKKGLSSCYLVTPDGFFFEPQYDGYGVFNGVDVYELLGEGSRDLGVDRYLDSPQFLPFDIKVVHEKWFNNENYNALPISTPCDNQGFFETKFISWNH